MNIQSPLRQGDTPRPLKLNLAQFWHLKQAGAFADYGKTELLEGKMSGVPLGPSGEPESDASVPIKLRVQDYLMLDEAGLLESVGKTELIDGSLYEMSPQHRAHWFAKNELTYRLRRALEAMGSDLFVGSEGSVLLSEVDLPEPDIIVTSEPMGTGPIPSASVRLLVEVADSSHSLDFGDKAALYARHGIPEYWVAHITARLICQVWAPGDEAYAERREVAFGARAVAATIAGLAVDTAGI